MESCISYGHCYGENANSISKNLERLSSPWCSGQRAGLRPRSKRVRTLIALLRSILYSSSSSSCRTASTDIPDHLSPLFPIVHRFWQVLRATSCILTELLYVYSSWSFCFCPAICGGPQEYISYELVLASPALSYMSGSSDLDSFRDGRQVAVQLVPCGVLPPGPVQYCSQHSCVIAVQPLLQPFSQRPSSASIQQYRYDHCLKETAFHFIGQKVFCLFVQLYMDSSV